MIREGGTMSRLTLALFGLALLLGAAAGCNKSPPAKPVDTGAPAVAVKAGELLKDYTSNAVAADGKYKGKTIEVSGKFGSAQKAPLYGYAIQLLPEDGGSDSGLSNVLCIILPEAEADTGKLKENDPITVKGICDGVVLGQVKLTKCTLVK
jgi:hypothetical protein